MRLALVTLLATLLTACGNLMPDVTIPDPTTTGQLIVAYDMDTQVLVLEPRDDCPTTPGYDGGEQILQGEEGIGARAYYGLKPGLYCLTWGFRLEAGGDAWRAEGNLLIQARAGALDFVSVVPAPVE